MTPDDAQVVLLSRRLDELEKQVSDALNGLMMLYQALQFWSSDQRYDEAELEAALDHAGDTRDCDS